MSRDDITRMAREAGWKDLPTVRLAFAEFDLSYFAALVAAAQREACAKQLDALGNDHCAAAIRSRKP